MYPLRRLHENVIPEIITGGLDFTFEKGKGVKGIRHPDAKMVRTARLSRRYQPNLLERFR